jgi:hypothetical protein
MWRGYADVSDEKGTAAHGHEHLYGLERPPLTSPALPAVLVRSCVMQVRPSDVVSSVVEIGFCFAAALVTVLGVVSLR